MSFPPPHTHTLFGGGCQNRTLRFFQQVSPQVQKQLCQVMTYKQFERGEVVFYQDDAATDFYIVLSGSFQVCMFVFLNPCYTIALFP